MGCGSSSDEQVAQPAAQPAYQQQYQAQPAYQQAYQPQQAMAPPQQNYGWGAPAGQVIVQQPSQSDPAFMRTVAPSGTSWGQYVRTGASFIDPKTGFLAGPWAECISWAVIFEHSNDWSSMPEYAQDGVVGGVLQALESTVAGKPNQQNIMEAAQRLEDASHALMDQDEPLPAIQQVITVPQGAVPGQPMRIANPQTPGTYVNVQMPPNAQPGQQILAPAPCQPSKSGGMSTGSKVALAAGGAVVAGGIAAAAYYGTVGGGMDGFVGDMGDAGDAIGGAAGDAADWAGGAVDTAGDAFGDAAGAIGDFGGDAVDVVGDFGGDAVDGVGDFLGDLF